MDCAICFEIMERELWTCQNCNNSLHRKCFNMWKKSCPSCRFIYNDEYTDCTFCCIALLSYIFNLTT